MPDAPDVSDLKSNIVNVPLVDTQILHRRRVFSLSQLRPDFRDAQTQFVLLLTQMHEENFTGQIVINYSQGNVSNVETIESRKLTGI